MMRFFGHVSFHRVNNPELQITANRERLIENAAFLELSEFVRLGIDFATVIYANEVTMERVEIKQEEEKKKQKEKDEIKKSKQESIETIRNLSEQKKQLRVSAKDKEKTSKVYRKQIENRRRLLEYEFIEKVGKLPDLEITKTKKKIQELILEEQNAISKEEFSLGQAEEERKKAEDIENLELNEIEKLSTTLLEEIEIDNIIKDELMKDELALLRVLAATGTLIFVFQHDIEGLLGDMTELIRKYESLAQNLPSQDKSDFSITLENFRMRIKMVREYGEFLGLTIGVESRTRKVDWVLKPIVDNIIKLHKFLFTKHRINISLELSETLRVPKIYRSELVSILHNLMSNAFKAVKGQQNREILIRGFEEKNTIHIQFLDTGKGLSKNRWEKVFEPFVSDSEPDIIFGAGTGLGLKIVRDIIRNYEGDVSFIDAPEGWVTCIDVKLLKDE